MERTNKAEAIRELLNEMGRDVSPKVVISRLHSRGITVTAQQVSNQKARLAKMRLAKIEDLPVSILKKVKALIDEVGSTDVVRRALAELDELSKGR